MACCKFYVDGLINSRLLIQLNCVSLPMFCKIYSVNIIKITWKQPRTKITISELCLFQLVLHSTCQTLKVRRIHGIHKRMVRFQKLTRDLFLTLHRHNVYRQQRQLSKFLMRYQQFASHAYCGASFQDGVSAGKGFLCAPF